MFVRCAFFRGRVKPGREAEFDAHVENTLKPLWARFPGAEEVRVLRQVESDVDHTRFEMVLAMRFASREAIDEALASDVRARSREASKPLHEMFEGDVFHTVFAADELPLGGG